MHESSLANLNLKVVDSGDMQSLAASHVARAGILDVLRCLGIVQNTLSLKQEMSASVSYRTLAEMAFCKFALK